MPTKKTYRKKSKKSYGRRKNKKRVFRPQRLITSGFPKTTAVRLRYVDTISLVTDTADTLASHIFRANSVYAPDQSGSSTAHQPMGYDEWSTYYTRYIVVGSKIKVTGSPAAEATPTILGVTMNQTTTQSILNDVTTYLEQARTNHTTYRTSSNTAAKQRSIMKGYSAKKTWNVTNVMDAQGRLGAFTGQNPDDTAYYIVSYGSLDPTEIVASMNNILVEIEYTVIFSSPKALGQS